jgi:hypothetical protein
MTAQDAFWEWFLQNERRLFEFDPLDEDTREKLFDEIADQLQAIDRDLTFEFGPPGSIREFVISAGGIKSVFPAVSALTASVPRLTRWRVTAFRPRRFPIMPLEINGKCVGPEDVHFTLVDNGKVAGIYLFIPSFIESDVDFKQIGYLLLDEALGEYDVETRLGLIKMFSPDEHTEGERHPLPELPALFDKLVARLERRSGAPS